MQCNLDFHSAKERPILYSNTGDVLLSHRLSTSILHVPVVHPENEMQNNMVATQYPGELRVAYSPAQLHQGYGQPQQNLQGLHQQQESQESVVSTGFHHSIPKDSACTSQSRHHQISREGNPDVFSSAQVSAHHSSYFGTLAHENPVRQSVINCGQRREDPMQNCSRHFLKRSNMKSNTGLQQRCCLNCASLACTGSAALQGVTTQTFPLQDQCSSVTVCRKQTSNPLLVALLEGNPSHSKSFTTQSLVSETNGNIELNPIPHFSDDRHHKGQQVKGSQAALHRGWMRTQNPDPSGGTPSTPRQHQVSSPSLNRQPSADKPLAAGEMEPPTDAEIYDFIERKLTYFRTVLTQKERNYGHDAWDRNSLHPDYTMPNSVAHLPTTSASDKAVERQRLSCAVIGECTAAVEEDHSKVCTVNTDLMPMFKEADNCATSASMKHSTGTLTMPANGSCKIVYSDDCGQSFELASLIENEDANTKKRKNADEHSGVTCKETTTHSELDSPVDKTETHSIGSIPVNQSERLSDQTSGEGAREDVGYVHSRTDLCIAPYESNVKEHATQSEREGEEACPQYEDISDDDAPPLTTTLPNTEHEEFSIPACIKDPQYEDISDADSPQNEYMTVETCPAPEPNNRLSSFEIEGYEHVQGQSQMRTEIIPDGEAITKQQISSKTLEIPQQCSSSCLVETDYGFEELPCRECNHTTQTNHSDLKTEDETDDEMDYDCFVLSVLDLQFEPDEDQDSPGKNVQDSGETGDQGRQCNTSPTLLKPVLAFDFPQLPVYDTKESFIRAMTCRFEVASGESTPEHEVVSEGAQNRRQSVDSCETEDSCDYSSASEHNYLTVSRKMLKKRSAPRPSETDVSTSEKEDEGDEVADTQKGQTGSVDKSGCMQKRRQLIEAKAGCSNPPETNGQEISQKADIIVIESDTEDESDHYCKKSKRKRKGKRSSFSSESEDSGDASCSQQKRLSPGPVGRQCGSGKEKFPKNGRPSADTPTPQYRSNDTPTEEMLQDSCSDLSHSTEKSGQLTKSRAASEHVKQVIIIDSDMEDDSYQTYKKQSRKRFFSSESGSDDAPCVEPETRLCSADSALLQHQSKLHDTQLTDVMLDACSNMSNNREKSGQLTEAKRGSAHVRLEANRQTASKRRVAFHDSVVKKGHFSKKKADKRLSTETVDHFGGTTEKPQKYRLSSEDSPEQQPPSVDREVDCPLGANPVIPRLIAKPSPPNPSMILLENPSVHKQVKAVMRSPPTSIAFSKKTDSCEKNDAYLCRNKPANNGHRASKNNLQANIPKPRMDSRQLSEARLSSASSRGLSLCGETSASSSLPTSKQSTSVPRQCFCSSKLQQSHSCSSPSTSSSATVPLSAKEQLNKDWKNSFYPTKRDKKHSMRMEEGFRAINDSFREARPGPSHHGKTPRQRHKSDPPLVKMIKAAAIQRTKDINRDGPKERCPVGEGYKWSDKPTVAKPTKGSSREGRKCRSPPGPHQ